MSVLLSCFSERVNLTLSEKSERDTIVIRDILRYPLTASCDEGMLRPARGCSFVEDIRSFRAKSFEHYSYVSMVDGLSVALLANTLLK